MPTIHLRRFTLPCCVALVLALVPVAAAVGASANSHSSNQATLTLSRKGKRALSRHHVRVKALQPASDPGSHVYFPQSSAKWNSASETGTLAYSGALRLRSGRHSVKLTKLSFIRNGKRAVVTARIGKVKLTLFTLKGRAHIKRQGSEETITGYKADLTKRAAKLIDRALHARVVHRNENLGSFAISVTQAGSGTTQHGVSLMLNRAFTTLLKSSGLPISAILPANGGLPGVAGTTTVPLVNGSSVTLPEGSGSASFDSGTLTGTIPLSGGLQLGSGTDAITLTNGELTLGTGTEGSSLSFQVNGGPEVKVFDVDTSKLEQSATANGDLNLSGLTATLSSEGASTINQAAGRDVVQPSQPVGGLTVIVPATSTSS